MYSRKEPYLKPPYDFPNNIHKNAYSPGEIESIVKKAMESCMPDIIATVIDYQKVDPELDLLSREETAKLLNVGKTTLHNYKHSGKLVPFKRNGRVYYRKSDVINYLNGKEARDDR